MLEDAQALGAPLPPAAPEGGAAPAAILRASLSTQYRSHEAIAGWASRESYNGRLRSAPSVAARTLAELPGVADTPLTRAPMLLLTTRAPGGALLPGCEELGGAGGGAGASLLNEGEADAVVRHVATLLAAGVRPEGIAVLSPYSAQVELLRGALAALRPQAASDEGVIDGPWVEVSSVDAYQGREADAVVISCVRANARGGVGFLADARRMNVAVTRGRCHVAIVADAATVGANAFLRRLLIHATDAGGGAVCVRDAAQGRAPWHADAAPAAAVVAVAEAAAEAEAERVVVLSG
jgi:superfamily I DNA and/or RNA helicase